ncbi:MAG: hypothetical protein WCK85_04525, partial [Chlorobium sp.]
MNVKDVFILEEAFDDLREGWAFYDFQEKGVGDSFRDLSVCKSDERRYLSHAKRCSGVAIVKR